MPPFKHEITEKDIEVLKANRRVYAKQAYARKKIFKAEEASREGAKRARVEAQEAKEVALQLREREIKIRVADMGLRVQSARLMEREINLMERENVLAATAAAKENVSSFTPKI
jgi:hypothetical protein